MGSIRVSCIARYAAFQFIDAINRPDELARIACSRDTRMLNEYNGVNGIARKVCVHIDRGVSGKDVGRRQDIYGSNQCVEKHSKGFLMFAWEAFQNLTLIILTVCAVVSIGVGLSTEGWPKGMYEGLGIIVSIFLAVIVTAISDYKQSVQFMSTEKKKISIQVTRDGYIQRVPIYDLVVGDVVHLSIGDQVPADGIFILGHSLLIDESSLSSESETNIDERNPFLLSGTKVKNGSGKMLVTSVGMRTVWGRLMETHSQRGEDETPLQVKLNGASTIIKYIVLGISVSTFIALTIRFLVHKVHRHNFSHWSLKDAWTLLNYLAISVTIIVFAAPEDLPLVVTHSLTFAMKKLIRDKALVRHLSACETMGSASSICTDMTGTLTTKDMVVDKIWISEDISIVEYKESGNNMISMIPEEVSSMLLQCIFQNTASEVVIGKDGKHKVLGTPTETALVKFGLLLGGDFEQQRSESKIVKIEPFNSVTKKMSVVVSLPNGGFRVFCKGASEIILNMCDKIIDKNGKPISLSETRTKEAADVINIFANEALRTLCLAFIDMDENTSGDSLPAEGYTLITVVGIKIPVRHGVKEAVQTCLAAGITVRMVTGDNINTAKAIAKECGILSAEGIAVEGSRFHGMTTHEMTDVLPKLQVMARSLPSHKQTLVAQLRKGLGEVVALTGDRINDALALDESDIGLALGIACL